MLRYKNFSLIKPDQQQAAKILELIDSKNGSVFQEVALNKIVATQFDSELFYLVDSPANISNFSPVHLVKDAMGVKRYHFKPLYDIPYAGFLNDEKINFNDISIGLMESFTYSGLPNYYNKGSNSSITKKGETCIIDLNQDEDTIFETSIHSKRRNMIRKAIKSNITVQTFYDQKGLEFFWPMLESLHEKLGYSHLTASYYTNLINEFGPQKKAFISVAFKDNTPISGIFVLGNRNTLLYYKGASAYGFKNEGQGELLQWEAIKTAKSLGTKIYDLGNLQKELLPAIYRFKTGISNRIIDYPVHANYGFGYKVITKVKAKI